MTKTIVLDDDPTGTQSATGVTVLLDWDAPALAAVLGREDSVYVQTNSRSLPEREAVRVATSIKADGIAAGRILGQPVRFVLRGDSTLRGHVFAESEVFMDEGSILVFVPAFPDGGRKTLHGTHWVAVGGEDIPADRTEYARDPVFPFRSGQLSCYVREKSERTPAEVHIEVVRGPADALAARIGSAAPGSVVLPDAETGDDITAIAEAIRRLERRGTHVVVRCAAPLAAELAGVRSRGLITAALAAPAAPALVVCGSHTAGATAQLEALRDTWGPPVLVNTQRALEDPAAAGAEAAARAREVISRHGLAIVATERTRRADHGTLEHGKLVMRALTAAVRGLAPVVDLVVAKGGITSADVARTGLGATQIRVRGQILPGISVWSMRIGDRRTLPYVVVPGNVGGPDTLRRVISQARAEPAGDRGGEVPGRTGEREAQ